MAGHVVAAMDEEGVGGGDALCKKDGLVKGLVGVVWQGAQSVDYQHVAMLGVGLFLWGNGLHVGDVD